jgi:hypothetical protein
MGSMHRRRAVALRVVRLALVTAGAGGFLSSCRDSHDAAAKARVDAVQAAAAAATEDSAPTLSPRNSTEELVAALDSPSEAVRLLALRSLGFKDDLASAVPVLAACLDDPSEKIARASRDVLAFYANRNPKALDLDLVDRLLNGEHASDVDHDEPGFLLVASLGKRGPESVGILTRVVERRGRLGVRAAAELAAIERARR